MSREVLEVIDKMIEFYGDDPDRWLKGKFWRRDVSGEVCAACLTGCLINIIGGVEAVTGGKTAQVYEMVYLTIRRAYDGKFILISRWNDAPERTFYDIKNLLARARERALVYV